MTAAAQELRDRITIEIAEAIAHVRHEFDVSARDCVADREAWTRLASDFQGLLWRAYQRNHVIDGGEHVEEMS